MSVAIAAAPAPKPRPTHEWPAAYVAIRARLDRPQRRVFTDAALLEILLPHSMPSDGENLAPMPFDVFFRLPHRQQVFCALVACEMVMPIWERWECDEKPAAPEIAMREAYRFFDRIGMWGPETFQRMRTGLFQAREFVMGEWDALMRGKPFRFDDGLPAVMNVVEAIIGLFNLILAEPNARATAGANSCLAAARAVAQYIPLQAASHDAVKHNAVKAVECRFIADWWSRCRARLAFADATTAHLLRV